MKRRSLLKLGIGAGVVAGAAGAGYIGLKSPREGEFKSLEEFIVFASGQPLVLNVSASGEWTPFQILTHLRQSIEFSVFGFPESHSETFQNTLGNFAFYLFSLKQAMTHDLSEPIPGAKELIADGNPAHALRMLRATVREFVGYKNELKPHFAYGVLTKEQYAFAHLMHINEHFSELTFG